MSRKAIPWTAQDVRSIGVERAVAELSRIVFDEVQLAARQDRSVRETRRAVLRLRDDVEDALSRKADAPRETKPEERDESTLACGYCGTVLDADDPAGYCADPGCLYVGKRPPFLVWTCTCGEAYHLCAGYGTDDSCRNREPPRTCHRCGRPSRGVQPDRPRHVSWALLDARDPRVR